MTEPTPAAFPAQMDLSALPDDALVPFGWAPGGYMFKCQVCSAERNAKRKFDYWDTAAKRASRCREHALEAALRAEKAKSEGLREAAEDAYRTLAQAFSRIHGLPRSTDTALATQIGQTRARIEAALQPTEEIAK